MSAASRPAGTAAPKGVRTNAGMALAGVLVFLLIVVGSSASFIWYMNQRQARAGAAARAAAALAAAEAGVHRTLAALETATGPRDASLGSPGDTRTFSESIQVGAFQGRISVALADDVDGAILITSTGQVAGTTRRLRARAYLASRALLAALYGAGIVRFEGPPARTVVVPYGSAAGDRPWIHIAAGQQISFASTDVSINSASTPIAVEPGPADFPERTDGATRLQDPGPLRLLLARGAELTLGETSQRVEAGQLRVIGIQIEGVEQRAEALPALPVIDRAYYQARARLNTANAGLNAAAGRYAGDDSLIRKADSLYAREQFERLLTYLLTGRVAPRLEGVVYVRGPVGLFDRQQLAIVGGGLVTEGMLRIESGATLQVLHSGATRTLPGIVVLDGALLVTRRARLRVHGLVFAGRGLDIWQDARVDVVGAVMGGDPGLSFRNLGGAAAIRYDPAVLGTPGLHVVDGGPSVAWVASWEELP